MRSLFAVLVVSAALVASPVYGRGGAGHARGIRGGSGGSGNFSDGTTKSVHVHGYTKKNGTTVRDYDRSAPGTSLNSGSKTTRSTKSTRSTSDLANETFTPKLAPKGTTAPTSASPLTGSTSTSPASTTATSAANLPNSNSTTTGNQTNPANNNNVQFVNGFPFLIPWGYTDPDTQARRQYGAILSNARALIRAGIYPQAAQLLQRVVNGAPPATRVATEARNLLASLPNL